MLSPAEVVRWQRYAERWPYDDMHRYHRPAALVSAMMSTGDAGTVTQLVDRRMEWLRDSRVMQVEAMPAAFAGGGHEYSEADRATMRAFGMLA